MRRFFGLFLTTVLASGQGFAQAAAPASEPSGSLWWIVVVAMAGGAIAAAVYFWRQSKKEIEKTKFNYQNRYKNHQPTRSSGPHGMNGDKDVQGGRPTSRKLPQRPPKTDYSSKIIDVMTGEAKQKTDADIGALNLDTKLFQERMRKLQYSQLPINSFDGLKPSKLYEPLPLSNDESLINAIDQANEEFEEDEAVRDLAVRILTAFRTRNSVEALSQIALYDLSANLRSKAVTTLTDFDHESVFEAILLACADPTREVRAAAARGLFRLNFDRADAWARIIETNDEFRMSHAARAAIEAGIVSKSFDRLVHDDLKVAYEAFVLVTLLIKAGETTTIFETIRNHRDERVRYALLHVLKVQKSEKTVEGLKELMRVETFPTDVEERMRETIAAFEAVVA
ncbi:MAG: HEAT repeat domain-containing protein [Pyrinomonadaceae bacterium]